MPARLTNTLLDVEDKRLTAGERQILSGIALWLQRCGETQPSDMQLH